MISVLTGVVLIPDRDLIRKVIFPGKLNRTPLHLHNIRGLFLIQIQHRLCARPFDLRVEGPALLQPIQLPDAQASHHNDGREDKQSGKQPPAGKQLKQEHFLFS